MTMFTDLTTERRLLRCIGYGDAAFFYRQFSDDDVNRYLYDAEPCASIEEAKEWIAFYPEPEPRNQHRWVMVRKGSGESIGTCGFHCLNRKTGKRKSAMTCTPPIGSRATPPRRSNEYWHSQRTPCG